MELHTYSDLKYNINLYASYNRTTLQVTVASGSGGIDRELSNGTIIFNLPVNVKTIYYVSTTNLGSYYLSITDNIIRVNSTWPIHSEVRLSATMLVE